MADKGSTENMVEKLRLFSFFCHRSLVEIRLIMRRL